MDFSLSAKLAAKVRGESHDATDIVEKSQRRITTSYCWGRYVVRLAEPASGNDPDFALESATHAQPQASRTLFQLQQPSGERPPGGGEWAAAVRVTSAEICY